MTPPCEILASTDPNAIEKAVSLLHEGGVIAHPTDTVYGVAADPGNPTAIDLLYSVKQRPRDKAIPLLLADVDQLQDVARRVPDVAYALVERFWPGGLTLVVPAAGWLPEVLTAGMDTVAVRLPDHYVPRELARRLGRPLAATSANISGRSSPVTAGDVVEQLGERISLVLDAGPAPGGVASTVIDLTRDPPHILREGAISRDKLAPWLDT